MKSVEDLLQERFKFISRDEEVVISIKELHTLIQEYSREVIDECEDLADVDIFDSVKEKL